MTLAHLIRSMLAAAALAALAGCTTAPTAPAATATLSPHASSKGPAVRPGPSDVSRSAPAFPVNPDAAPLDRGFTSGRALGPLVLYGQLPELAPPAANAAPEQDNLRQVTFAAEGCDRDPDVDPTGTFIVYASTRHRATADVYLQRIDGTAVTQLTDDPANDLMPRFSPDGKRIAFASDRAGNWDIYLMDAGGGQPVQQLTADSTHDLYPSFSPDGRQLVYCSFNAQSRQWEMVLLDLDKPGSRRILGHGLFPHFSPDGRRLVFQRARERGTRWFGIWTIDLVNGEGVRPTEIAASANAACITPRWSPDGRRIVFCTVLNPDPPRPDTSAAAAPIVADVWVMNADGSGRTCLTHRRFANTQPVWTADNTIFFTSNRAKAAGGNIWALRPGQALLAAPAGPNVPGPVVQSTRVPAAPPPQGAAADRPAPDVP